jgi:methyl-accepting chemotaxis protein
MEHARETTTKGNSYTATVSGAFEEILAETQQVDHLAGAVADGSTEQSRAIAEIKAAVAQMDDATQANAASAEEGAAAAAELHAQASTLNEAVARLHQLVRGTSAGDHAVVRPRATTHAAKPAPARQELVATL